MLTRIAILTLVGIACSSPAATPAISPAAPPPSADPDPDGDRIEGAADRCPDQPEAYNGNEDDDGCPDRVREGDCRWIHAAEILDRFFFASGSAELRERTLPIVDAVAATIKANPAIDKIGVVGGRVPGEPDSLALERAQSTVTALVARGVDSDRLETHGHLKPIGDGDHGRAVWFVVLRIEGDDRRPASGDARWIPWERDCAASWKAHRERDEMLDCDCLKARPPDPE